LSLYFKRAASGFRSMFRSSSTFLACKETESLPTWGQGIFTIDLEAPMIYCYSKSMT
jgi:hypothetical protein